MNRNEQQEYEKEFSNFLIQKINHAGGSLQFQHLSGLLPQLRYEIRDAFGVTKSELMKFLKVHSITFKINSKGIVTVVSSSTLESNDCIDKEESLKTTAKKTLPKIKNGRGRILKIFPDYAIIETESPIETYVFFTPLEYENGEKDSLFVDFDLHISDEVYFNAVHGHSDYEIEYRATEVWSHYESNDESGPFENYKSNKMSETNKFRGEGIIKKLFPNVGFISVTGERNNTVFFYRTSIKDHSIKVGDHVEFVAEYESKEWRATELSKKKKDRISEPSAHFQTCFKTKDKQNIPNDGIKNQSGKIYPYDKGAVIKFGKNDSEIADGNSCNFYLYGFKVMNSDIAMEFSEGDVVKFDAIKSGNSPGWKAVLVWVGERPKEIVSDIDTKTVVGAHSRGPSEIISDVTAEISDLSLRMRKSNNYKEINSTNKRHVLNDKNKVQSDSCFSRNKGSFSKKHHQNNTAAPKMVSQRLPGKDFKFNRGRNRRNDKSSSKHNQKMFTKATETGISGKSYKNLSGFEDTYSAVSECSETSTSEENNELQDPPRKFLIEAKQCSLDTSELQENLNNETYSDSESDKVTSDNEKTLPNRKSSIKILSDIDGKIITVHCKFAIIKSDCLIQDVDFFLGVFYLNGTSVEEQQIADLKEVIDVGDIIKFNCFEIIDDYGEIHQKVTLAWKGSKPNVFEVEPDEFISQHEIHVTVGGELDHECESDSFGATKNNISGLIDHECEPSKSFGASTNNIGGLLDHECESGKSFRPTKNNIGSLLDLECESGKSFKATENTNFNKSELNSEAESSLSDSIDDISCENPAMSRNKIEDAVEGLSPDIQNERLPDRIYKKLENCGFISSEPEVTLNVVQEIIELVLKNLDIDGSATSSASQDSAVRSDCTTVCLSCAKGSKPFLNTKDSGTQTIVTGEIVLTSIFPEV